MDIVKSLYFSLNMVVCRCFLNLVQVPQNWLPTKDYVTNFHRPLIEGKRNSRELGIWKNRMGHTPPDIGDNKDVVGMYAAFDNSGQWAQWRDHFVAGFNV